MVKKTDTVPADIAALGFEDALKELETIVRQLEEGRGKLDDAIGSYVRGAALKRHCEAKLAEAKARIETIALDAEGGLVAKPADLG